jgi:hypothetical protein
MFGVVTQLSLYVLCPELKYSLAYWRATSFSSASILCIVCSGYWWLGGPL